LNQAVQLLEVTKSFKDTQAVKGVTLEIGEGEFFSLLGPSGCGKTTLLRMIAGFEQPTTGKVIISGKDMTRVPPHKRSVNMVFQNYALFPHLTVFDNVAFGLRAMKSCPSSEIYGKVTEALNLVRLAHLTGRYPRELSGGQQQRIAFARAIVNKPSVLLMDEPLSALDPRIRDEMQAELARFKAELNITFVMVTHDQSEAFALSDRIAVFNNGLMEQLGTPEEIYEKPASAFVADFIGETNLLTGRVAAVKGALVQVEILGELVFWATSEPGAHKVGDEVTVWTRTDGMTIAAGDDFSPDNVSVLKGTLVQRSYQGAAVDFRVKLSGLQHIIVRSWANEGADLKPGDEVTVLLPVDKVRALGASAPSASPAALQAPAQA
jgi:spermidine/putrescine transport system ATP-binding protein